MTVWKPVLAIKTEQSRHEIKIELRTRAVDEFRLSGTTVEFQVLRAECQVLRTECSNLFHFTLHVSTGCNIIVF